MIAPTVVAVAHPRNPELEAALRADRADLASVQVYADWLQAHGSVVGELIIIEQELARGEDEAKRTRADAICTMLALPKEKLATFGWRTGMWQWIRFENNVDWMDNKFDALELVKPVFESPLCAALEELRLGCLRWDLNYEDVPAVLVEAGKHAWAKELVSLHLGDVDRDVDMDHHVIGDVGSAITGSFPGLRSLKLHSGSQTWATTSETFGIGPLELPELTSLVIETCAMTQRRIAEVLGGKLPKLETLELWFGAEERGANAGIADLRPLFNGRAFPALRHLALRNAEFVDVIAQTLPTMWLAKRLERLDLSMGTLSDDGAAALVAGASAFAQLKTLTLDDNFVSEAALDAVRSAFEGVEVHAGTQKADDIAADGTIHRYVSVQE